jgi:hypothetical protein
MLSKINLKRGGSHSNCKTQKSEFKNEIMPRTSASRGGSSTEAIEVIEINLCHGIRENLGFSNPV